MNRKLAFQICLFGTVLFMVLVHWAMLTYQGGTIHDPGLRGYSFSYNFLSDLGRVRRPNGGSNYPTNLIFKYALSLTGICITLFFGALPGIFHNRKARVAAILASVFGMGAGICYVGIGWVPYDFSYGGHYLFVRAGFLSFLMMSVFFAGAIFWENGYPKRYAWLLLVFSLILLAQLLLRGYGERPWRSNGALLQQATAQKVVVYAEVALMFIQTWGAIRWVESGQGAK